MIMNGMNPKYENQFGFFLSYDPFCFISQPGSRQVRTRQQSSRRSASAPRESQRGIKALVMTPKETEITKVDTKD